MQADRITYRSYLLRLWWNAAEGNWRASLQSTATGQIISFATVETLRDFLLVQPAEQGAGAAPLLHSPPPTEQ
jgi:hypothetical protein